MKRIRMRIEPYLLVGEGVDELEVQGRILDALRTVPDLEGVTIQGAAIVTPARTGVCREGGHTFAVPDGFPSGRPVPELCQRHAYDAAVLDAGAGYAPVVDAVEHLTGMRGHVWQSGGMTMTVVWGDEENGPAYLGLEDGVEGGKWWGSVSWYPTQAALENGEGVEVVTGDEPATPQEWANHIAEHFRTLPLDVQARLKGEL